MGSKKETMVILVVLLAAGFLFLSAGVASYLVHRKTTVLRQDNAALQQRLNAAKTKVNKLSEMRRQREVAQARLEIAESVLPSQKEIEALVDNLSEFAKQSGVIIAKVQPMRQVAYKAQKGTTQRFDEAVFDLDLVGNYFQFVEFLNCLENYKRFIKVDSFNLAGARTAGDPLSISLKFATYTYVDAAVEAPKPAVAQAASVKGAVK